MDCLSNEQLTSSPIFVGGDGRSGTTLVSTILDTHPGLAVGPELYFTGAPNLGPFMLDAIRRIQQGDPDLTEDGIRKFPELKPALRFPRRVQRFGVDLDALSGLIAEASRLSDSHLETFPQRCVLVELLGQHIAAKKGASRWGMKIMRSLKRLPMYSKVWPSAQFIHVVRDGRDVAASQVLDHPTWGYRSVPEAAQKWSSLVTAIHGMREEASLYELRYEDLVSTPEEVLRSLTAFLRVDWHDSLLRHSEYRHEISRSAIRHPSKEAVREPINTRAIGRYRSDLSAEEISVFHQLAEDAMTTYGYLPHLGSLQGE